MLLLAAGLLITTRQKVATKKVKLVQMIIADLLLLLLGGGLIWQTDHRNDPRFFGRALQHGDEVSLMASVAELPVRKGKWLRCELRVQSLATGQQKGYPAAGKLLAYFPAGDSLLSLTPARTLWLSGKVLVPDPPMNPSQFDYRSWLAARQIYFTMFLREGNYSPAEFQSAINPLWQFGLECRSHLLRALRTSGMSASTFAICAALLTGQDDDIDRETITAFAHSGTLHILSVSGLHTGLVFLALNWLFTLIAGRKKYRLLRFVFITLCLWLFALMTGFAAPVLRAVIMFNLVGIGAVFFRHDTRNVLNLLCLSAFVLLFYNPFFLFDVGFLLSYFAMFGILHYTPKLAAIYEPRGSLDNAVWQSVSASVAATVTTLPITLLLFKQFPLWFFLSNLVVVPLSFVLLMLSVLAVFHLPFIGYCCDLVARLMKWCISFTDVEGWGYIDAIDFKWTDALYLTIFIVLVSHALTTRSYRASLACLVTLLLWQVTNLVATLPVKNAEVLTVYHLNRASAVSVKSKLTAVYDCDEGRSYDYSVKPRLTDLGSPRTTKRRFNYVRSRLEKVFVYSGTAERIPAETTVLVLQAQAALPSDLASYENLRLVVSDGSHKPVRADKARELCRKFGLAFYSTAERGALELALR